MAARAAKGNYILTASKKQKAYRFWGIAHARIKQEQTLPNVVFLLLKWK